MVYLIPWKLISRLLRSSQAKCWSDYPAKKSPITCIWVQLFPDFLFPSDVGQLNMQNVSISGRHCGPSGLSHGTWKIRADLRSRRSPFSLSHTGLFTRQLATSTRLLVEIEPEGAIWMRSVKRRNWFGKCRVRDGTTGSELRISTGVGSTMLSFCLGGVSKSSSQKLSVRRKEKKKKKKRRGYAGWILWFAVFPKWLSRRG